MTLDGSLSFWRRSLWLLEVSKPACSFPELGPWGSKGATGPWVWRAALVPAAGGSSLEYG